jgi:hypothetical protein
MENTRLGQRVRREIRAVLKLSPWVLISLLLAMVVWRTDLAAVSGLFQSPETPTATTAPPTATLEAPTATVGTPALTPTSTLTVTLTLTPTKAPEPTKPPEPTALPTEISPEAPVAAPSDTPTPAPVVETAEPDITTDENERYAEEGTDLRFDWDMLFDSVALGVSYIWLCCGILLFLAVPVVFAVLWAVSKRRQEQEE